MSSMNINEVESAAGSNRFKCIYNHSIAAQNNINNIYNFLQLVAVLIPDFRDMCIM